MSGLKGDFMGFTFNGKHSSSLGITRVSEGSRYNDDLLPSIEDKTVRVPGGDGSYYFGSYYTSKNFNISIAFDNLTELQFRTLKKHFGAKQIGDLIFDEIPYKIYKVKVTTSPNVKYICFDNENGERIYKGEGNIMLSTLTSPFARSRFKYLDLYNENTIKEWQNDNELEVDIPSMENLPNIYKVEQITVDGNKEEWAAASGMLTTQGEFDKYYSGMIKLYNPGDLETDFLLRMKPFDGTLTLQLNGNPELEIKGFELLPGDNKIQINSKTELIEGIDENNNLTGNIYNKYILGGAFFKIPCTNEQGIELELIENLEEVEIIYNYLYF